MVTCAISLSATASGAADAFNTANALGPFLAGAAIAAGWGLPSTGAVGCALTLGGLAVWGIAWWDGRRAPLVADKAAQQC